nr:retrovirus-related Pol polyprotein from transposon TNT 1-94 [Tanacetum cinerariifolium]
MCFWENNQILAKKEVDIGLGEAWSSPLTHTGMVDFVPGRAVIDATHRKRVKYEAKCADIGYAEEDPFQMTHRGLGSVSSNLGCRLSKSTSGIKSLVYEVFWLSRIDLLKGLYCSVFWKKLKVFLLELLGHRQQRVSCCLDLERQGCNSRIKMRALLIQHGYEAALEVLPVDMEAQTKTELNKKAYSTVILCLGTTVLREVIGQMNAAGVWSKLKTLYMTNSLANKLYMKKKLYTFNMPAGREMFEHIDKFNKIILNLANVKLKFKDEDLALLLLTCLPASYERFVDTLLYGRETLTLEDVLAKLNSKEIKERSKMKGGDGEGLYVRGRIDRRDSRQSRGKSRSKSQGGRIKCYICQSDDHLKRNCPKNNRKKLTYYVKKDMQPSSSGSTYDDSEVMMVYILRFKHEAFRKFKEWKQLVENQNRRMGKKLRMDNGLNLGCPRPSRQKRYIRPLINRSSSRAIEKDTYEGVVGKFKSVKGYRLYRLDDESPKIVTSWNVVFNKSVMYKDTLKDSGVGDKSVEELHVEVKLKRLNNHTPEEDQTDQEDGDDKDVGDQEIDQPPDLTDYQLEEQDLGISRSSSWEKAGELQMAFKIKEGIEGVQKPRYKARLVVRGFTQRAGIDYNEVKLKRLNNHTPEEDQTDQEDGDDKDAGDQEIDQPPDLTDYQLVYDRDPRTRAKPLRFRDERNVVAYAFVAAGKEDTHEPLTYQEAVACLPATLA